MAWARVAPWPISLATIESYCGATTDPAPMPLSMRTPANAGST